MAKKSESVKIRLDPGEKTAFQSAAEFAGLSFSAWVRERLRRAARLELEEAGEKAPFLSSPLGANVIQKIKPDKQLQSAVEKSLNCNAQMVDAVQVSEAFQGKTVWEGTVFVFEIKGHPQAKKCYAWASPLEGSTKKRYYAALHIPPIDSPEKAVRAAIVHEKKINPALKEKIL